MGKRNLTGLVAALLVAGSWSGATLAQADPDSHIQQARSELSDGNPQTAFEYLRQYENRFAGQPDFDYWYGVAALRSGEISAAILALQRTITEQPNHAGARLELAGAYLREGQYEQAEAELDQIENLDPPEQARQTIERLRGLLADQRQRAEEGYSHFMFALDLGYDSNFLNYPSSFDLFANTFLQGLAILESESTQFVAVSGAWHRRHEQADSDYFFETSLSGSSRLNRDDEARAFDTDILQGSVGLGYHTSETSEVVMGLDVGHVWLDRGTFRRHQGFSLGWRHELPGNSQLRTNFRMRDFDFDNAQYNYRAYLGELDFRRQFDERWRIQARAALEWERTTETEDRPGGDGMRQLFKTKLGYRLSERHDIAGRLAFNRLRYSDQGFTVFNQGEAVRRDDEGFTSGIEWTYTIDRNWRMGLDVQYREQTSTVDFFNLDQVLAQWNFTYVH